MRLRDGLHECVQCTQICPVCAAHPSGNPNHLTDDFPSHLTLDHSRSLRDVDLISSHAINTNSLVNM